jgi:H+/Cl- antiporter ClcA
LATKEPTGNPQQIAAALQEVTERAQVIVREEIELARTEITQKLQRLAKGAAVGAIAGVFVLAALVLTLHGLSWLAYYILPVGKYAYFWGFFVMAVILLILGAVAGFLAARFFKAGTPPVPELAIEEAQRIRETVHRST